MFAFATGVLVTTGKTVPGVAVSLAGLAEPRTGMFVSGQVARCTVGIARGSATP